MPTTEERSRRRLLTQDQTAYRRWLTRDEAAEYLGISADSLATHASRGTGPRFSKPSRRIVRYDVADLDAWMENYRVARSEEITTTR